MNMNIEDLVKEEKNLYQREWRAKNKDKVRVINKRYWEKRALKRLTDVGKEVGQNALQTSEQKCNGR